MTSPWILLLLVLGFSGEVIRALKECTSDYDEGEACEEPALRYYFDVFRGRCKAFSYNGCGGNENRYVSIQTCQIYCMGKNLILFLLPLRVMLLCSFRLNLSFYASSWYV